MSVPLSSEIPAASGGSIAAVDCVMAVQARPGDKTCIGCGGRRTWNADKTLITAVCGAGMPRPVMAILTEVGNPLVQEFGVRRAMRAVAGQAVLLDSRVLKEVRASLV